MSAEAPPLVCDSSAVCCENPGREACIDETLARKAARAMGLAVTGTIGLLEYGRTRGWLDDDGCLAAVARLRGNGFHCPRILANDSFADYLARMTGWVA